MEGYYFACYTINIMSTKTLSNLREALIESSLTILTSQMSKDYHLNKLMTTPANKLPFKYRRLYGSLAPEEQNMTLYNLIEESIAKRGAENNFFSENNGKLLGWVCIELNPLSNIIENIKMCSFDVEDTSNNIGEFYSDLKQLLEDLLDSYPVIRWTAHYFTDSEIEEIRSQYGDREAHKANQLYNIYKRLITQHDGAYRVNGSDALFEIRNENNITDDLRNSDLLDLDKALNEQFDSIGYYCVNGVERGIVKNTSRTLKENLMILKSTWPNKHIRFKERKDCTIEFIL